MMFYNLVVIAVLLVALSSSVIEDENGSSRRLLGRYERSIDGGYGRWHKQSSSPQYGHNGYGKGWGKSGSTDSSKSKDIDSSSEDKGSSSNDKDSDSSSGNSDGSDSSYSASKGTNRGSYHSYRDMGVKRWDKMYQDSKGSASARYYGAHKAGTSVGRGGDKSKGKRNGRYDSYDGDRNNRKKRGDKRGRQWGKGSRSYSRSNDFRRRWSRSDSGRNGGRRGHRGGYDSYSYEPRHGHDHRRGKWSFDRRGSGGWDRSNSGYGDSDRIYGRGHHGRNGGGNYRRYGNSWDGVSRGGSSGWESK
eukprot:589489_1